MGNRRLISIVLVFILLLCPLHTIGFSEQPRYAPKLEFLTGYGSARIKQKGVYHVIPFFFDFNFDLTALLEKHKIRFPGSLTFVLEPFISYVFSPNRNVEVGNNIAFKIGILAETSKLQPYFKGGSGPIFISQHTREQGTQFNFNDFAALGVHYFFTKTVALTFEYRFRHISNAEIKKPNRGIDSHFGLCGVAFLF